MNLIKHILLLALCTYYQIADARNWQFENMRLISVDKGFEISFDSVRLPMSSKLFDNVVINCLDSQQIYPKLNCNKGTLSFIYQNKDYTFLFKGQFDFLHNKWNMVLSDEQEKMTIQSNSNQADLLLLNLYDVPFKQLEALLKPYVDFNLNELSGRVSSQLSIDLSHELTVKADYQLNQLNWESEDGNYVLADTEIKGNLVYKQNNQGSELTLANDIQAGEGLFADIYLLFTKAQVATQTQITFDDDLNLLTHKFSVSLDGINQVQVQLDRIYQGDLKINFNIEDLNLLKEHELYSYLEILGLDDLEVVGQAFGSADFINNKINKFEASIKDVSFEIESKKTEALDLNAELNWQASGTEKISKISWENMLIAGMPIGSSQLLVTSVGNKLSISPESIVPVFDGGIIIHQLNLDKIFAKQIDIDFDGEVTPISLALITEKMNWPIMQGSISGKIPGMKKHGQSISFDGSLDINVFDGKMKIDHLSMERLFAIAPVIAADVSFHSLNLNQITSTFDFGKITGLIDGTVNGLRITNWKADRMDASIVSVPSKRIKQTISQRAIDNISSIGGIQGAISRSFLRFFDSFKYKKIGIGCKLRNSICEMSGIKTEDKSTYKLIEGRGIPSINIIGFKKFIDWEVFLDRLLNAGY